LGLKLGQTKPKTSGTVLTNSYTTIPNDSGPISASFDDDPNCSIRSALPVVERAYSKTEHQTRKKRQQLIMGALHS
jgi:hypothetical protein